MYLPKGSPGSTHRIGQKNMLRKNKLFVYTKTSASPHRARGALWKRGQKDSNKMEALQPNCLQDREAALTDSWQLCLHDTARGQATFSSGGRTAHTPPPSAELLLTADSFSGRVSFL